MTLAVSAQAAAQTTPLGHLLVAEAVGVAQWAHFAVLPPVRVPSKAQCVEKVRLDEPFRVQMCCHQWEWLQMGYLAGRIPAVAAVGLVMRLLHQRGH